MNERRELRGKGVVLCLCVLCINQNNSNKTSIYNLRTKKLTSCMKSHIILNIKFMEMIPTQPIIFHINIKDSILIKLGF